MEPNSNPIEFSHLQNSNLSDYDLNSPDILCSPTNFSDIYFGGARNLSVLQDLGGVADPECSDNSNEGSMQVSQSIKHMKHYCV